MPANWGRGRTDAERGYGSAWKRLRKLVLARDNHLCRACMAKGRTTPATHCDHITPKSQGGTDDLSNLQAMCADCHHRKTIREKGHRVRPIIGPDGWPIEE